MADAVIDMSCPPPFLDQHQELLEHAREAIISILPVIDEKGLTLDEIVVVAADPTMAERVGRPPVSVSLLEAVLANVTDPDNRRRLMKTPEPGVDGHPLPRKSGHDGRRSGVLAFECAVV